MVQSMNEEPKRPQLVNQIFESDRFDTFLVDGLTGEDFIIYLINFINEFYSKLNKTYKKYGFKERMPFISTKWDEEGWPQYKLNGNIKKPAIYIEENGGKIYFNIQIEDYIKNKNYHEELKIYCDYISTKNSTFNEREQAALSELKTFENNKKQQDAIEAKKQFKSESSKKRGLKLTIKQILNSNLSDAAKTNAIQNLVNKDNV